jgi:hypothetical protein
VPIIIDITEAGRLVPHWRPYRKDEDVQRVYEETLSAGYSQSVLENCDLPPWDNDILLFRFQPNFQQREIQQLWNLEVIELRLLALWEWPCREEKVEPGMDGWTGNARHDDNFLDCTILAKTRLMKEAFDAHYIRRMIEYALADHGRAQTAPARLTKGSKYEAKLNAIRVKDEANRKANRKLSFEARARKLVDGGDAPSLSTAKNWLRDLDSRQH